MCDYYAFTLCMVRLPSPGNLLFLQIHKIVQNIINNCKDNLIKSLCQRAF